MGTRKVGAILNVHECESIFDKALPDYTFHCFQPTNDLDSCKYEFWGYYYQIEKDMDDIARELFGSCRITLEEWLIVLDRYLEVESI